MAVGQPGQLRREFVPLAGGGAYRHGKAIIDDAGDLAFHPADMIEVGDHAIADIADAWSQQGQPARRHIDNLAGKLTAVGEHVAAKQVDLDPLKASALFGGWNYGFLDRQRHLRHPTTRISISPTLCPAGLTRR